MPIKIPDNLPAKKQLEAENIFAHFLEQNLPEPHLTVYSVLQISHITILFM